MKKHHTLGKNDDTMKIHSIYFPLKKARREKSYDGIECCTVFASGTQHCALKNKIYKNKSQHRRISV